MNRFATLPICLVLVSAIHGGASGKDNDSLGNLQELVAELYTVSVKYANGAGIKSAREPSFNVSLGTRDVDWDEAVVRFPFRSDITAGTSNPAPNIVRVRISGHKTTFRVPEGETPAPRDLMELGLAADPTAIPPWWSVPGKPKDWLGLIIVGPYLRGGRLGLTGISILNVPIKVAESAGENTRSAKLWLLGADGRIRPMTYSGGFDYIKRTIRAPTQPEAVRLFVYFKLVGEILRFTNLRELPKTEASRQLAGFVQGRIPSVTAKLVNAGGGLSDGTRDCSLFMPNSGSPLGGFWLFIPCPSLGQSTLPNPTRCRQQRARYCRSERPFEISPSGMPDPSCANGKAWACSRLKLQAPRQTP